MNEDETREALQKIKSIVPLADAWCYEADCMYALAAQMSAHARLEHRHGVPDWGNAAEYYAHQLRQFAKASLDYHRRRLKDADAGISKIAGLDLENGPI